MGHSNAQLQCTWPCAQPNIHSPTWFLPSQGILRARFIRRIVGADRRAHRRSPRMRLPGASPPAPAATRAESGAPRADGHSWQTARSASPSAALLRSAAGDSTALVSHRLKARALSSVSGLRYARRLWKLMPLATINTPSSSTEPARGPRPDAALGQENPQAIATPPESPPAETPLPAVQTRHDRKARCLRVQRRRQPGLAQQTEPAASSASPAQARSACKYVPENPTVETALVEEQRHWP